MNLGILLDSHAMLWLDNGEPMLPEALSRIFHASATGRLYTSQISIWEMGVAANKKQVHRRPDFRGRTPAAWFTDITEQSHATALPLSAEIAAEAANVPAIFGFGDPGDCFLIATARIHSLALITRDARILTLATREPAYLTAIPC